MRILASILLAILLIVPVAFANGPQELTRDSGNRGTTIQGFAPKAVVNYYLTKSQTLSLMDKLVFKVQSDADVKMYLGSDAANYYTIFGGTPETFVVNATQAVFAQASSAKTAAPNLRIIYQ